MMGRFLNEKYWLHTWEVGADEDTDPVRVSGLSDKTLTVDGTFDGSTVTIQGSMDSTNWHTMTGADGDPATFTSEGMLLLIENPRFIRVSVNAGTGGADLTVSIGASALL
jgi:hypothetical protein